MFDQEKIMTLEHEILKENHETLKKDYEILELRIKHAEETYEVIKLHLENKAKELELANIRLVDECQRERSEKEKCKKMLEEMKKTKDNDTIDELKKKNTKLLLAKQKEEEVVEKLENKYVELAYKFGVIEAECAYLKSLYDAEVAASGTPSAVMSGIGETDHLIGQGENEVNHNVIGETDHLIGQGENEVNHNVIGEADHYIGQGENEVNHNVIGEADHYIGQEENEVNHNVKNNNDTTAPIVISDESDGEHDKPPRQSNITPHLSVDRNQEEQCRNRANSSMKNRALGETITPMSVNNPPPFSASSSSSSSSSSDSYECVVKLPRNWPKWAIPKGGRNDANKS